MRLISNLAVVCIVHIFWWENIYFHSKPIEEIVAIMDDIDLIRKPDGSKKYPALTCKNLFKDHPHLSSGKIAILSPFNLIFCFK